MKFQLNVRAGACARIAVLAGAIAVAGCSGGGVRDALGLSKKPPDESEVRVVEPLSMPPNYSLPAPDHSRPAQPVGRRLPPRPPAPPQSAQAPYSPPPGYPAYPQQPQYPPQAQYPQQQAPYPAPNAPRAAQYPPPAGQPAPYPAQAQYPAPPQQPVYQPYPQQPQYPQQAQYPQYPQAGAPANKGPRPVGVTAQQQMARANAGAPGTQGDMYARWGVSKYKADGTKKTDAELRQDARKAYIAKKKSEDSDWGTAGNLWEAIFGD